MSDTNKGRILNLIIEIIKERPALLDSYPGDFFMHDHPKIVENARRGPSKDGDYDHYILGLRKTGSELFQIGEEPGSGNCRSGAVLDRKGEKHAWFLLSVERKDHGANDAFGLIVELNSAEEARRLLQKAYENDPDSVGRLFA